MKQQQYMVPNEIAIRKVANGFAVEMPRPMNRRQCEGPSMGDAFAEGLQQAEPYLRKIMEMRDSDSVLERIREENEEKENKEPAPEPKPEQVGIDPYTFVFSTWGAVLDFLTDIDI